MCTATMIFREFTVYEPFKFDIVLTGSSALIFVKMLRPLRMFWEWKHVGSADKAVDTKGRIAMKWTGEK